MFKERQFFSTRLEKKEGSIYISKYIESSNEKWKQGR